MVFCGSIFMCYFILLCILDSNGVCSERWVIDFVYVILDLGNSIG